MAILPRAEPGHPVEVAKVEEADRVAGDPIQYEDVNRQCRHRPLWRYSPFSRGFLWGVIGTFREVPITIALMTFCGQHPSSRWLSELYGLEVAADYAEGDAGSFGADSGRGK